MYNLILNILDDHCTTTFNKYNGDEEIQSSKDAVIEAMRQYGEEVLKIAAEKAKIEMKKKSHYGKYRKWQNVKIEEEEVDLSDYTVQYFVNKESILNCLK